LSPRPDLVHPFPSASPAMSSSSGISTKCFPPPHLKAPKKHKATNSDAYVEAVQSLADSLRQSIVMAKNDNSLKGMIVFNVSKFYAAQLSK